MHHQRAGAAGNRRRDRRVLQLHARVLDRRAIGADRRVERGGAGVLRVELFVRGDAAIDEVLVALGLRGGVGGLRLIALEVGFRLLQGGFERPPVEREEHLPRTDVVAFLEGDGRQLAGELRVDGDVGIGSPDPMACTSSGIGFSTTGAAVIGTAPPARRRAPPDADA